MKPLSRSRTAIRIACAGPPGPDGAAPSAAVMLSVIEASVWHRQDPAALSASRYHRIFT